MIDFQQLLQFVTVAETGSLSAAAEQLHLSQPALSRSMQRLESELGLTLFERSRNRIALGELGLYAAESARELVREAQRYAEDLRDYAERLSTIRIGASSPTPMWRLSAQIHERFPNSIIAEEQQETELLLPGLREGRFRLILTHVPVEEKGILCGKYLEERLLLEMPTSHPLASRSALEEQDLNGLTVLAYRHMGIWRGRLSRLEGLHRIEQEDLDVLEDLALSTGLPLLTSSLLSSPTAGRAGRVSLPIPSSEALLTFYLCARDCDRELYDKFC